MHTESEEVIDYFFELLEALCKEIGGFDLKSQLIQIHKDAGGALEQCRKKAIPGRAPPHTGIFSRETVFTTSIVSNVSTDPRGGCAPPKAWQGQLQV